MVVKHSLQDLPVTHFVLSGVLQGRYSNQLDFPFQLEK